MASFDALAEAYVRLRAKDDGTLGRDVQGIVGRVATDAASLFAGKKLLDVGVAGLDELKQAEVESAQTDVQLRATAQSAGVSKQHIDELSQSMLDLAGFDDEAAKSAANVILQFNNIKGVAAFDRVEKDAADLAVTLASVNGGVADISGAARTLGLALQDPEKGIRLLRSANIVLTDSQKEQLKAAVLSNDAAKEQNIILGAVEARVHGAAAAYGDSLAGGLQRSREEMKNAKAELVGGFTPAIDFGTSAVTGFAHAIEDMPPLLQATVGGTVFLGGGIVSLVRPVRDLLQLIDAIRNARAASAAATALETAAEIKNAEAVVAAAASNTAAAGASAAMMSAREVAAATAVATNEQIVFSDAQVVAAQQARVVAEFQALVGNSALIAADEALVTAEEAVAIAAAEVAAAETAQAAAALPAAAAGAGVLGTLLPIAAVLGVAAAGWYGYSNAEKSHVDVSADVARANTQQLVDLAHQVQAMEGVLGITGQTQQFYDKLASTSLGTAQRLSTALKAQGEDTSVLDAAISRAAAGQAQFNSDQQAGTGIVSDLSDATGGLGDNVNLTKSAVDSLNKSLADRQQFEASGLSSTHATLDANIAFAQSERGVTDALRSVSDAQQRVADAQQALNDARRGASDEDLGKGQLDIQDANLRVADSADAVSVAEKQLEKDRRLHRSPATLAEDQRKLEAAQISYQRAVYGVTDAEGKLQDLQAKGSDQDPAVITAKQNLAAATDGVTSAEDRLSTAKLAQVTASIAQKDAEDKAFGATQSTAAAIQNQITGYQTLEGQLDPSSPLRKNIESYIADLLTLQGILATQGNDASMSTIWQGLGQALADQGKLPPGHAAGGKVVPGEMFMGAEKGWEILASPGLYQSIKGGGVFDHDQSMGLLGSGSRSSRGGDTYITNIYNPEPERASNSLDHVLARHSVLNGG